MENSLSTAYAGPENRWQLLDAFTVDRLPGNESLCAARVAQQLAALHLAAVQMEQLTQAVAAAVLHMIEHNPAQQSEPLVQIQVMAPGAWRASPGHNCANIAVEAAHTSALQAGSAPVAGGQPACCWGFFLVERSVDLKQAGAQVVQHTIDLFLYQEATGDHV